MKIYTAMLHGKKVNMRIVKLKFEAYEIDELHLIFYPHGGFEWSFNSGLTLFRPKIKTEYSHIIKLIG